MYKPIWVMRTDHGTITSRSWEATIKDACPNGATSWESHRGTIPYLHDRLDPIQPQWMKEIPCSGCRPCKVIEIGRRSFFV